MKTFSQQPLRLLVVMATAGFAHAQPAPPTVQTLPASVVGATSATLNGSANPWGTPTFARFEWGTNGAFGNVTPAQPVGSGAASTNFSQALTGLVSGVTYHFRAIASNTVLQVVGSTRSFTFTSLCLDFNNGQLPPNSVLFGNATISNGVLRLTENINSQIGSFILEDFNRGAKVTALEARFDLRIGNATGSHADGFSFVWSPDLPNIAFGEEEAGGLVAPFINGFHYYPTGLAVSFDTFSNGTNDPAPAVDVLYGGAVMLRFPISDSPLYDFNTVSSLVPVSITVSANGLLNVMFNSYLFVSDLALPGFQGLAGARFGWGARTGGFADNHFVDNICLNAVVPCATPSILINRNGASVTVAFTGTLQSAPTITGPWTGVSGAISPHVVSATGQKFFRAVAECGGGL